MLVLDKILDNENNFIDFITRSTYHSNAIEGSNLTYSETMQFFSTKTVLKFKM